MSVSNWHLDTERPKAKAEKSLHRQAADSVAGGGGPVGPLRVAQASRANLFSTTAFEVRCGDVTMWFVFKREAPC